MSQSQERLPSLQQLTIQFRSHKWSGSASVEQNMRTWYADKVLDELIDTLRHIYYPDHKAIDVQDLNETQLATLRDFEDADEETQDALRDTAVRDKLKKLRQLLRQKKEPRTMPTIRIICMCRTTLAQYMLLTAPPGGVAEQPRLPPAREGDEFFGFSAVDLEGRGQRVVARLPAGKVETLVARTVFADRNKILLALEIFCVDTAATLGTRVTLLR